MNEARWPGFSRNDAALAWLLVLLILVTDLSMVSVRHNTVPGHPNFWEAVATSLVFVAFIPLFLRAGFSFGWFAGISFYSMMVGFFWLTFFGNEAYNHTMARWSAVASLLLFLLPVLFQTVPAPKRLNLSPKAMDRLVLALLFVAAVVLVLGASYGFALVGLSQSEELRSAFARPAILNYLIGSLLGAALPFAFAYLATQRRYTLACIPILLIWGFYPVVLNKSVVFGGVWLPFLLALFRLFEPKRATVLSVVLPMLPGMIGYELVDFGVFADDGLFAHMSNFVFGNANIRLFAFPSIAMNQYSDFFTTHPLTHFCQIGIIRAIHGCPYPFQLGAAMSEAYHMGSLNGSLFATEGIASVGPVWAPVSALVCGLIVSLGNSASARLPAPLIATSAGLAVQQALLNVPLSASLLSNGVLVLFLLWAVAPRPEQRER
jgi:hypothetical protein